MQVKGKILDEFQQEIVGAHVVVLNPNGSETTVGTFTDFDGVFFINNPAISSVSTLIRISAIGFKTITIPVATLVATKNIVVMQTDTTVLNETVVYGTKKMKFNWLWLLIPAAYATYELTKTKPKKVKI